MSEEKIGRKCVNYNFKTTTNTVYLGLMAVVMEGASVIPVVII